MRVEGSICGSMALKSKGINKYWDAWLEKHIERVAQLEKNGDFND